MNPHIVVLWGKVNLFSNVKYQPRLIDICYLYLLNETLCAKFLHSWFYFLLWWLLAVAAHPSVALAAPVILPTIAANKFPFILIHYAVDSTSLGGTVVYHPGKICRQNAGDL